ncbi:hypothetical protein BJX63DRAFT_432983 [Aspergillus granulosus]|uniref:F-box domain-containing protein n=1 Tax=Aspergillus granulosus TaxID=176169 RepID=A0ABR4HB38_9EURO
MLLNLFRVIKAIVEVASIILMLSAYGLYHEARLVPYSWKRRIVNALQVSRARRFKRSTSRPILNNNGDASNTKWPSDRAGFHHLPLEIQQQIFDLVLPPRLVIQPEFRDNRLFSRTGTFPNQYWNRWDRRKHIRDDADPPSEYFAHVLAEGGWYLDQTPEPVDPGAQRPEKYLICGFAEALTPERRREYVPTPYVDLLRVDRRCYATVLDDLYRRHTISFFGPEMLSLFMDNASVEGMERIRYVHLGAPLPKLGTKAHIEARKFVAAAIARMAVVFQGLEEFDVEIALPWDPKAQSVQDLSNWVFTEAFASLRGLKKFVLKVSVLKKIVEMRIGGDILKPVLDPLKVLSTQDHSRLTKRVMEKSVAWA